MTVFIPIANASDMPVAHWKFDESSGLSAADSAGEYSGVLVNMPTWQDEQGQRAGALEFDGVDDRVDIGTIDLTGSAMSIAFWFKADDFDVPSGRFISKTSGKRRNKHFWMVGINRKLALRFLLKTNNGITLVSSPVNSVVSNQWYHITVTYDGTAMKIYRDGELIGSRAKTGQIVTNGDVFAAIGNQPKHIKSRAFDGLIDDMRIYNTALSVAQIQQLIVDIPVEPPVENIPPIANAGTDQTLLDSENKGLVRVLLNAQESSDSDGTISRYEWYDSEESLIANGSIIDPSLAIGTHKIALIVFDDDGASDTDEVIITIKAESVPEEPPVENVRPIANAGADQTLLDSENTGFVRVLLNAQDSSDSDGTIIRYEWYDSEESLIANGSIIDPSLPIGTHKIILIVFDDDGASDTDEVIIIIEPESISEPPPTIDRPPTINITSPSESTAISGSVTVVADARDDKAVISVQFKIDGFNLGTEDFNSPYTTILDSTTIVDGTHTLSAIATDSANQVTSSAIFINVSNANPSLSDCADGIDNDNDGLIDFPQDPGCSNANGNSEVDVQSNSSGIVYVRVPRTHGQYTVQLRDGSDYVLESPDVWDKLPDSRLKFEGFNAPGQLIYQAADGSEKILYDCFTAIDPCVPLDPSVSFDGTKVLFSVYRGRQFNRAWWDGTTLPNQQLGSHYEAQLHIVDISTGQVTPLLHTPGETDFTPIWLPDGRIMFASNRAGTVQPWLYRLTPNTRRQPQLYIADADGSNAINVSPHELATAMHPYVLNNGRVAYSSHWMSHNLAFVGTNGGINFFTTTDNLWVVTDINIAGGDTHALLGAHREHIFRDATTARTKTFKALHFLGQRNNDDICTTNYYRGNNLGLGDVFCWTPEQQGVEGALPTFLPRNIYNVASWSKSNDENALLINGIFQGKIAYPEGLANNQLMLTVGRGMCATISGTVVSFQNDVANQPGKIACDVGIYQTTQIPSTAMSDLQLIVDRSEWHEFGARVVQTRVVNQPPLNVVNGGKCILASSDAGSAETTPHFAYKFNNNYRSSANHGSQIDGIDHAELAGMRFWEVLPNFGRQPTNLKSSIGNDLKYLGDVDLLADNSFAVELPCDTPYIMAGIDDAGDVIMRDQIPQSLRPGEERVCTGCHLHSKQGRPYNQSLAYTATPKDLTVAQLVPTFEIDIKPIFTQHCASCHTTDVPVLDYDKLVWDFFQTNVPLANKIQVTTSTNENRRYGLHRPYTSKYVNNMFARESLLYWKAVNQRLDGRTDATYPDDIDFGADHPTTLNSEELKTLGLWLDSGAMR